MTNNSFPGKPELRLPKASAGSQAILVVIILAIFLPVWIWFFWRIEPAPGELAVLIRKTGRDLPSGQILATNEAQKGIRLEVLPEGRYFRNPYSWGWQIHKITDIPAGKVGVMTRLSTSSGVMPGAFRMILTCVELMSGKASIGRLAKDQAPMPPSSSAAPMTARRSASAFSTSLPSILFAAQHGLELGDCRGRNAFAGL